MCPYKFNPFTDNLDYYSTVPNPLLFKGQIDANSDFPTAAEVEIGWFYTIGTDVTDDDASKTNTGLSFKAGDEIAWDGTTWIEIGNSSLFVRLDQSTPQTITGDTPKLDVLKSKSILGTDADGKIIEGTHQDLSSYVPYSGATDDVDLGANNLTVDTNTLFVDSVNDRVGIGTTTPSSPLQVVGTSGLFLLSDTVTNATNKYSRIATPHYTNAEEPSAILLSINTSANNNLNIGGGTSLLNAVTKLSFYTAENTTTTTGTERMTIGNTGNVGIGTTSPRTNLDTDGVIRAVGGSYTAVPGTGSDTRTDVGVVIPAGMSYSGEWNGYIRNLIKWDSDDRDIDIGQAGTALITNINLIAGNAGNIKIPRDNSKLYFGTGDDASMYYDGTNLIINPKEVGSGILDVAGTIQTDGYNSADGTAGITTTFVDGGGNTIGVKDGLIVSKTSP
jgi:hypothetical protein